LSTYLITTISLYFIVGYGDQMLGLLRFYLDNHLTHRLN
jgi:hypothetical protein